MKYLQLFENFGENLIYNWFRLPLSFKEEDKINRINDLLTKGIKFGPNDNVSKFKKYPYCISTTRNDKFRYGSKCEIRVVLDRYIISHKFRVDAFRFYDSMEYEERIYSKVPTYLSPKLILRIECDNKWYDTIKKLDNPNNIEIKLVPDLLDRSIRNTTGGFPNNYRTELSKPGSVIFGRYSKDDNEVRQQMIDHFQKEKGIK